MERIFRWSVKRSGAAMTITGQTASGTPTRVTDVVLIEATDNGTTATGADGARYALMPLNALEPA